MTPRSRRPAPARSSAPAPEARRDERPAQLLQRLQGGAGNRAAAGLVQRQPGGAGAPPVAQPSLEAFNAANPGIVAALSLDQLTIWHDVITGWAQNRKVDDALVRHEKRERATFLDPASTGPILSSDYLDEHRRIESRRKFVDEGKSRFPLDPNAILSPEVGRAQPFNIDAEQRFRTWAIAEFASKPLFAELSSKGEIVSQLERTRNPGLDTGIPHVNLLWGGGRMQHTKGIVTWDDLMSYHRLQRASTTPRSRTAPRSRRCARASPPSTRTSSR